MQRAARSDRRYLNRDTAGGLLITAGGLGWTVVLADLVTRPTLRAPSDAAVVVLVAVAALLVTVGLGLRLWGPGGGAGRFALVAAALGIVSLFGPMSIAGIGLLVFVGEITAAAIIAVRAGLRPAWAFMFLAAATVLILGSATGQVLFAIPFGIACVVLGVVSTSAGQPAPVRGSRRLPLGVAGVVVVALVVGLLASGVPARLANRAPSVPARTAALPIIHVVVDSDMLGDDWMAILYLLSEPAVDLRAITVAGTSPLGCDGGTKAAQRLLAASGHDDVPVACGQDHPLAGSHYFPPTWGADALALLETLDVPPAGDPPVDRNAVDLLAGTARAGQEPIVVAALGPLTNVALALRDTGVSIHVSRIVAMGGALNVPGNVGSNGPAEWNIYVDPHAANVVLRSGVPTTLVALDATDRVPVTAAIASRLSGSQPTQAATMVGRILAGQADFIASGQYSFWDPLAATIARDDRLARLIDERIRVVEDGPESGRTVRDEAVPTIQVAVNADAMGFERTFIEALSGQAR